MNAPTIPAEEKGKTGVFLIKQDMAKAHDSAEWMCLNGIMLQLSFLESFVGTIKRCHFIVFLSVSEWADVKHFHTD